MQVITGPGRSQSVMLAGSGTLTVAAVRFIQCPCPEATLYREQAHARAVAARQRDAQQVRESSNAISAMMDADHDVVSYSELRRRRATPVIPSRCRVAGCGTPVSVPWSPVVDLAATRCAQHRSAA